LGLGLALAVAITVGPAAASAASGGVSGTVTDETTQVGIEEIRVCAYPVSEDEWWECEFTGPGGFYQIGELPPGDYLLEFSPRPSHLNYLVEYYDDQTDFELAEPVAVVEGSTTSGIDAELAVGGRIKGEVRTTLGTPLEEVFVCPKSEQSFGPCAETDSGGDYELVGLRTDTYRVGFSPVRTEQNLQFQYWDHKSSWADADPIAVTAGATATGIDGELPRGAEIRGTVRAAATNLPLPWIVVCAIEAASGKVWRCTETGSLGGYAVYGLPAGPFKVGFSLELPEFLPEYSPEELPEPDGWPSQFYDGRPTLALADVLNLAPPATVSGVDARLGPPAPAPPALLAPAPTMRGKPPVRCRKGFRKKRIRGRVRCVKKHRRPRRHAGHGHRQRADEARYWALAYSRSAWPALFTMTVLPSSKR
jgi:hypothetical protein